MQMVNPVPRTYVRGFGALPFGEVQNIHPRTHVRGVLWCGVKAPRSFATMSLVLLFLGEPAPEWVRDEIPFVPTPVEVVDRMLEIAEVTKDDVVYDLGSGDGRIVIRAAKKFGARGVGFEVDSELVELSRKKAAEEGVSHLVQFRAQDALTADVSNATVVTLYMLPWFNEKIRPVLQGQLRRGARVVSHDFGIEGWLPTKIEEFKEVEILDGGRKHRHRILLWRIGENHRSPEINQPQP